MLYHDDYEINKIVDNDSLITFIISNHSHLPETEIIEIFDIIINHKNFDFVFIGCQSYFNYLIISNVKDETKIILAKKMIEHPKFEFNCCTTNKSKNYNLTKSLQKKYFCNENTMLEIFLCYIKNPKFDPNLDKSCKYNALINYIMEDLFTSKSLKLKICHEYFNDPKFDPYAKNLDKELIHEIFFKTKPLYYLDILELLFRNSKFNLITSYKNMKEEQQNFVIQTIKDNIELLFLFTDEYKQKIDKFFPFILQKYKIDENSGNVHDLLDLMIDKKLHLNTYIKIYKYLINHPNNKKYLFKNDEIYIKKNHNNNLYYTP